MRKALFLIIGLALGFSSFGQKEIPEFGKIDMADLQMKSCAFEPEANAMKLFDVETTEFDMYTYSIRLKSERRIRIKIFNKKGYEHAEIRIPYYSKKGVAKIKELSGAVYSLDADGKIVVQKLEKKDFFKEKALENVGLVSFTFPNLKPGCVIEYRYTTIENNVFSIAPWHIQDEIPVQYTSKSVTTPVECRLIDRPFGIDSLARTWYLLKNDRYRRLIYFHENVPSFKVEPFMSSINDHRIKASFLLFPRGGSLVQISKGNTDYMWASAARSFITSNFFENQVRKIIPGTEKIIDTAKNISQVKDRVGFVYREVKKLVPEKAEQSLSSESLNLEEVVKNKAGTSAEINLVLLNLLLNSNVSCMPAMISTKEHGKVNKDFPSVGQFNGFDVLALDTNAYYLLDASIKYQSFLNPPLNIMNREVFLIGQDSAQWILVTDKRPLLKQTAYVIADLDNDGDLKGTGTIQHYDYAKSFKLDTTLNDESSNEDKFYDKAPLGLKIISATKSDPGTDEDPLFETIEFTYEPQKSDDFIFINPQILTERNKNPFIADNRTTDIDFGCNQLYMLNMEINLSPAYEVEHLPKNITVRAPDSSLYYRITYSSDSLHISISQSFETRRAIYTKEEYPGIQDFFKQMYSLMSKEIILKKKKK